MVVPPASVKTPLLPMANDANVPCVAFTTNRKSPLGEMAMELGFDAGEIKNGDPDTVPKLPVPGSTVKAVMLPEPWFAVNRKGAVGDMAIAIGPVPAGKTLGGFDGTTMLVLTGTERLPLLLL